MTPDALPEGLVERCATKLKSLLPRNSLYEDEYEKLARAVLAVAAPALREQALRKVEGLPKFTLPRSKVRDLEAENSRLNAELMRERSRHDAPR